MTEITLNTTTLPSDESWVAFELVEDPGNWLEGQFRKEDLLFIVNSRMWYQAYSEVSRWKPIDKLENLRTTVGEGS